MNTIDNPFLSPPGAYAPTTVGWEYFSSEMTPGAAIFVVPWQPGTPSGILVPVQWKITDIFFRQETASSSAASTLQIQRYTGTSSFSPTNNINDTNIVIPTNANECMGRPFTSATIDNPFVNSGDKLAPSIFAAAGSGGWSFVVTMTQVPAGA
jgi:hypothetical protein